MPLFIFISGFLFKKTLNKNSDYWGLLKKKTIQLLYPYLIFSINYYFLHKAIIWGVYPFIGIC